MSEQFYLHTLYNSQNKNYLEYQYQLFLLREGIRRLQFKLPLLMTQVSPMSVLETAEVERGYTVKRIWKPLEYTRRWFLCGETNSRQIAQTGRNIKKHPSSSLFYRKESKVKKLSRQRFFRVLQQLTVIQASEIIS